MAYTVPLTAVSNAALTASQWNASVRDNLLETATAKATTGGSYPVASGPNQLVERFLQTDSQIGVETTTSTTYTDLATVGPALTFTSAARAIIFISVNAACNTVGTAQFASADITGATTFPASDNFAIRVSTSTINFGFSMSYIHVHTMTSGVNTATLKYRTTGGTATFVHRRIGAMPF